MTIQTELATVQADVTAEINKSTAQIAVARSIRPSNGSIWPRRPTMIWQR